MHDRQLLSGLFETGAVLSAGERPPVARGRTQVVEAAAAMWIRQELYLAGPSPILQTGSTALIAGRSATSVARRSDEGVWRYAITLLHANPKPQRSTT
jgi:hypothetical protein